jgi:ABC-type uncharacterized transport system involved in gliding motility auxiliary subunit
LDTYLANGGSVIVLLEPTVVTNTGNAPDPLLDYLATSWGIGVTDDLIIDTSSSQPLYAVADSYGSHTITEKLQNTVSFFPTARSLTELTAVANVQTTPLVVTSSQTWGETDFAALQNNQLSYDASIDLPGPLTVAMAAENSSTHGRIVVVGDADFASNTFFSQYANGDLFINSVDWGAQQENMINLTTKAPIARQLSFISNITMLFLTFSFACLIPGLVAAGGVASWLIRRSRG